MPEHPPLGIFPPGPPPFGFGDHTVLLLQLGTTRSQMALMPRSTARTCTGWSNRRVAATCAPVPIRGLSPRVDLGHIGDQRATPKLLRFDVPGRNSSGGPDVDDVGNSDSRARGSPQIPKTGL